MKKKGFFDKLFWRCEYIALFTFTAALIYMFTFFGKEGTELFRTKGVTELNEWKFTDASGNTDTYTTPYVFNVKGLDESVFTTKLPDSIPAGSVFAILNRSDIKLYVDDRLIYKWDKSEAPILGGPPKNSFMFVDIKSEYAGKKLTMVKHGPEFSGRLFSGYVGPKDEVIRRLEKDNGMVQFCLSVILLILSLILITICIILEFIFKQNIKLIYVSMGVMTSCCWLTFDSFVFEFATKTRFIDGFMSYISTLVIIFPFLLYLDSLQDKRYRKYYALISLIEAANTLLFTVLHITGIASFAIMLLYLDLGVGIGILATFMITFYDIKKGESKSYRLVSWGFLIFMVSTVVEITLINMKVERVQGSCLLAGLYILLGFSVVQQVVDIKRVQSERNAENSAALARTQFLANMSHEIRTPINAILGMNEMIMKENTNPSIANYSKIISDSGVELLSLINDVLDFSKIQSGISDIEYANYNPVLMHERVGVILQERAKAKGLKVKIATFQGFPETLYGDERHITQVLLNIITNAVKYTDFGSITFTAECRNDDEVYKVVYYVSDTGKGIKSENLESIFDPFTRKDMKVNRSIMGSGLGLSITKQLVEQMGGTITVESVYGKGSTFCVTIPQEKGNGKAVENSALSGIVDSFLKSDDLGGLNPGSYFEEDNLSDIDENYIAPEAKVLVVDDVRSNLIVVEEFLRDTKMTLDLVESGKEALKKCERTKYDVILMDHMMPEPDGIQTMHMIRDSKDGLNKDTPIIILTANALKGSKSHYENEGFDNYLSKPVESKRLLQMVRKYLPSGKVFYKPKVRNNFEQMAPTGEPVTDKSAGTKQNKGINPEFLISGGPLDFMELYKRFEYRENTVNVILTEIVKEGRKKIVLLRELFEAGDIKSYAIEAHGVKGVMASSCAEEFSAVAKSHELAAKEGRIEFIEENIDDFLEQYDSVLKYVSEYLEKKGITVEEEKQIDLSDKDKLSEKDLIKAAIDALNDFDADKTLGILESLKKVADEEKSGKIEEIIAFTDEFEYVKATDALNALLAGE